MKLPRILRTAVLFLLAAHASAQPLRPKEADTSELAKQTIEAYRKGDIPAAIALATQLTEAAPKQPSGWLLRAQLHVTQQIGRASGRERVLASV